jgi:putative transferase (TIGR04331 family)
LDGLYEKTLSLLAESLNKIHGERHSIHYWRVLIGPWLGHYIQILFDRHEVVKSINFDYKIKYNVRKPKYRERDSMIPLDMHEFQELYTGDNWNAYIFAEILSELNLPNICISEANIFYRKPVVKNENSLRYYLKKILSSAFSAKNQKIFMAATFMPKISEIILQIKLRQIPRPVIFKRIQATQINPIIREKYIDLNNNDRFEKLLGRMILKCIPVAYLEGYESLKRIVENTGWPKNPEIIWTSNAETFEETFKCYAAKNIEKSTKLFIGQHGGNFGLGLWSYQEDHHLKISFKYLPDILILKVLSENSLFSERNSIAAIFIFLIGSETNQPRSLEAIGNI